MAEVSHNKVFDSSGASSMLLGFVFLYFECWISGFFPQQVRWVGWGGG